MAPIPILKFKKLHPDAIVPRRWSAGAIGWDVHAHSLGDGDRPRKILVPPRTTRKIPTGLLIEPPAGHFVLVTTRSGLGLRSIVVSNSPGIIDPDYRGELFVLLLNNSHETCWIEHQERIAQLFLLPVCTMAVQEVQALSATERGGAGLGSTGRGLENVDKNNTRAGSS